MMQIGKKYWKVPGKVLLAGGYGVLEHQNYGLSLAVNCFFYSTYTTSECQSLRFIVNSKQISSSWEYEINSNEIVLQQLKGTQNKYLYSSIFHSLNYFKRFKNKQLSNQQITIQLLFDKGFLSNTGTETTDKFIQYQNASKQGLGSSACVVVSIVKILCQLFEQSDINVVRSLSHVSNLAAQTKIGSNFDIQTAVSGTQLYKNVLPKYALEYLKSDYQSEDIFKINIEIDSVNFGDRFDILLVDLFQGSNTVVMVTGFLSRLKQLDSQIEANFYRESKELTLELFDNLNKPEIDRKRLKEINEKHRRLQQHYGGLTNTEIEPISIKEKIDRLCEQEDVLYVICPGSGGYDAVAILVEKGKEIKIPLSYVRYSINQGGLTQCSQKQVKQIDEYIHKFSK